MRDDVISWGVIEQGHHVIHLSFGFYYLGRHALSQSVLKSQNNLNGGPVLRKD